MSASLDGKKVRRFFWENYSTEKGADLVYRNIFYGDREEQWIIEYVDGKELARHSCRYIRCIVWEE